MTGRLLKEVYKDQNNLIIGTPALQNQSRYPFLLKMTLKNSILLPNHPKVLLSHHLVSSSENSSSNSKLVTETGGMSSIRESLSSKGI